MLNQTKCVIESEAISRKAMYDEVKQFKITRFENSIRCSIPCGLLWTTTSEVLGHCVWS